MKIVQIAHGKIIPLYTSAYSLRCHRYISLFKDRLLISVSGLVFKDKTEEYAKQYRSILTLAISVFMKNRSLEYLISRGKFLRRKYLSAVRESINSSEIVVFEGPWQFYLFAELLQGKIVIYDAHNVETNLRRGNKYEKYTKKLEQSIVERADLIITVTEEDSNTFLIDFAASKEKLVCIPEGFQAGTMKWEGLNSQELVFIGSAYAPNIEAVKLISSFARNLPDFKFKIIGTVCSVVDKRSLPLNIELLGEITDKEKNEVISGSFLALNPVNVGSGRNLKVNDYVSHGVPVLTTETGARGFDSDLKNYFFIEETNKFPEKINWLSHNRHLLQIVSTYYLEYIKNNSYEETENKTYETINHYVEQFRHKSDSAIEDY